MSVEFELRGDETSLKLIQYGGLYGILCNDPGTTTLEYQRCSIPFHLTSACDISQPSYMFHMMSTIARANLVAMCSRVRGTLCECDLDEEDYGCLPVQDRSLPRDSRFCPPSMSRATCYLCS